MALSVGSPRPAVSGHPTRRSSDFPPSLPPQHRFAGKHAGAVGTAAVQPPCATSIVVHRDGSRQTAHGGRCSPDLPCGWRYRSPRTVACNLPRSSPRGISGGPGPNRRLSQRFKPTPTRVGDRPAEDRVGHLELDPEAVFGLSDFLRAATPERGEPRREPHDPS